MLDQSELCRLLARAIAYKRAGRTADADAQARALVTELRIARILSDDAA